MVGPGKRMEKMRIVVDTNAIAYYILGVEPYNFEIKNILKENIDLIAPESWKPELMNVLWLAIKKDAISLKQGIERLNLAKILINDSVQVDSLWNEALVIAIKMNHSPYDTIFVALAKREKIKLLTYDKKILRLFPEIAFLPNNLLEEV